MPRDRSEVISVDPATVVEAFRAKAHTAAELDVAVEKAREAQLTWSRRPADARVAVLRRFADLLDERQTELSDIICSEVGKLYDEARAETAAAAFSARWYADHAPATTWGTDSRVERRPLGVIAAITPWNVPVVTPAWKWLPALAAGNSVVWKPSEFTSWSAMYTLELLKEAGLPTHVMEPALGGADQAMRLARDPRIAGIHFTGSTAAGRGINAAAATRLARVALELGGVNPAVVFADADFDAAVADIVASATAINGQKCTAVRRVLVDADSADTVIDRLVDQISTLRVGDPREPTTQVGPLIHQRAQRAAQRAVDDAVARGATVVARAPMPERAPAGSSYFPPTLLAGVPRGDRLEQDEVFAPILSVQTFTGETEAFEMANASAYGLSAAVYTRSQRLAHESARAIRTGVLAVNRRSDLVGSDSPFGGRGESGNGFPEGGTHVYRALTDFQALYGDLVVHGNGE